MTDYTFKPGDIAMVQCIDGQWRQAVCEMTHLPGRIGWRFPDRLYRDVLSNNARPLVVIDPEDREQVERLAKAMHESDHIAPWHDLHNETRAQIEAAMQAALRSLIEPPRPDEPTGLGAVVEDADGDLWIRDKTTTTVNHWKRARGEDDGSRYRYGHIGAVRILSEGVTA